LRSVGTLVKKLHFIPELVKPTLAISEEQVSRTLTVQKSIPLARQAYLKLAKKEVLEPLRTWFTVPGGSTFYFMPAHVLGLPTVSIKVVSVNHQNLKRGLPSTVATIFVFDSSTGEAVARVAGDSLTAIRTAASSALATDILAREDADSLGIIGTGAQAQAHLPAMLHMRDFRRVLVYSRSTAHRASFLRKFAKKIKIPITAASSADEVACDSDVLVLATGSAVPVLKGSVVRPGSHVNVIGSALPGSRETDTALVRRSILVVDSKTQALGSYGDIIIPLKTGAITKSHMRADLGQLLLRPSMLQRRERDITLFKAGGLGVLDAVFADYVVSQHQT
jgi:ornithine cyclodeaminase/alanine dehydrogenase-like protein (mu-crystallin family)